MKKIPLPAKAYSASPLLNRKTFLYLSLFWIAFGLFTITSSYVYFIESSTPFDWVNRLLTRMPSYLTWILFIPLISYLVSRFRIESPVKLQNIVILLSAGVLISALHRVVSIITVELLEGFLLGKEMEIYTSLFVQKFALLAFMFDSYIMYWIIISILLTVEYYKKYNENRLRASELERQLAEAEVSALKMQINPHFLFNTLHSISALTHKNPDEADRMICLLSDLLRISLDNTGRHFVPLDTELDFVNIYLQIQKIRFKERLKVNITTEAGAGLAEVPNLILQPIVENSIKHVLEKSSEQCIININSYLKDNKIVICIADNGKGIEESVDPFNTGLGLSNLKSRLNQLYNKDYEMSFNSNNGSSFEIILKLPIKND